MPAGLVESDFAQLVDRARQLHLHFPIEIGQIEELEPAVREQSAKHLVVLGNIPGLVLSRGAQRIRAATTIDRLRKQITVRRHDIDLNTFQGNLVADFQNRSFRSAYAEVAIAPSLIGRLDEIPAIETGADRNQLGQGWKPALVVGVKVAEDEVVDLLQAGGLRGREDPLCVAITRFKTRVV